MECEHIEGLLSPYLENDLSPEQKLRVEEHLQGCPECRKLLSILREVRISLAAIPEVQIRPALRERVLAIPQTQKKFRLSFDFLVRPSLQPILAAATALLTVLSFYAFSPQHSAIHKSIEHQIHQGYSAIGKLYVRAESLTNSLAGYKEDVLVSIKSAYPLHKNGE